MNTITNNYIKTLVEACKQDSFINPAGKKLSFFNTFGKTQEKRYVDFKAVCIQIKDNASFGSLSFEDQLEILSRIKEIYHQVKSLHPEEATVFEASIHSLQTMMQGKLIESHAPIDEELARARNDLEQGWAQANVQKCQHTLKKLSTLFNEIVISDNHPDLLNDFTQKWSKIYEELKKNITLPDFEQLNKTITQQIQILKKVQRNEKLRDYKIQITDRDLTPIEKWSQNLEKWSQNLRNFIKTSTNLELKTQINQFSELKSEYENLKTFFSKQQQDQIDEVMQSIENPLQMKFLFQTWKQPHPLTIEERKRLLSDLMNVSLTLLVTQDTQSFDYFCHEWDKIYQTALATEQNEEMKFMFKQTNDTIAANKQIQQMQ